MCLDTFKKTQIKMYSTIQTSYRYTIYFQNNFEICFSALTRRKMDIEK